MAQQADKREQPALSLPLAFMAISGLLLWLAQKQNPIGTSYAVWNRIGAAGTFYVGVLFYGDPTSLGRYLGIALIVAGVCNTETIALTNDNIILLYATR